MPFVHSFAFSCGLHTLAAVVILVLFAFRTPAAIPPTIVILERWPTAPELEALAVRSVSVRIPAVPKSTAPEQPAAERTPLIATAQASISSRQAATIRSTSVALPPHRMTIDEFRATHGSPKTAVAPAVTPQRVSESFHFTDSISVRSSQNGINEQTFVPALLRELRETLAAAGLTTSGRSATVQFSFRADGTIEQVKVTRPSGEKLFDQTVVQVFQRVRVKGFSPHEVGRGYEIDFHAN